MQSSLLGKIKENELVMSELSNQLRDKNLQIENLNKQIKEILDNKNDLQFMQSQQTQKL